jgi:hypothetical protein
MPLKFWDEAFSPLCFSSIAYLLWSLPMPRPLKNCSTPNQPILSFRHLVVLADRTYVHIIHTNLPFCLSSVPFLGIVPITRDTSVSTFPWVKCIFLMTSFSTRMCFPLLHYMPVQVHDLDWKSLFFPWPSLTPCRLGVALWTLTFCLSILMLLCSLVLRRIRLDISLRWIGPY